MSEVYPETKWQRRVFHFHKNVMDKVSPSKKADAAAALKAIHAQESAAAAKEKTLAVADALKAMKLLAAAKVLREGADETLTYYRFPRKHHRCIRTNNMLERTMKEIRRRTRVVGSFPDGKSALMLACARLRHIASKAWSESRVYLDTSLLKE